MAGIHAFLDGCQCGSVHLIAAYTVSVPLAVLFIHLRKKHDHAVRQALRYFIARLKLFPDRRSNDAVIEAHVPELRERGLAVLSGAVRIIGHCRYSAPDKPIQAAVTCSRGCTRCNV
jgi:hypothetical protein